MASDPLELEHLIGFCAVQFHPRDPNVLISHIGCLVIIGKADDAHQQEFLRGHTEEITCLAISPSGNLIASGQASSVREPNSEALVIVWDYATRRQIYSLGQLHDGIAFSRRAPRRPAAPSRQRGRPVARAPAPHRLRPRAKPQEPRDAHQLLARRSIPRRV